MTINAFNRIKTLLAHLKQQAQVVDQKNALSKSHKLISDNALFSEDLFITHSDKFVDYLNEIEKKTNELERLINANKKDFAFNQLPLLEQQISSLINALNANNCIEAEAQLRLKAIKSRQYKKAAKNIMQSSHQLHQSLAEHHEFERRLQVMLAERELALKSATSKQAIDLLSKEALALHQRLGRCRQAISKIERQIEFSEKRHSY